MGPASLELELTPDLLEYAKAVALKEAAKHCGRGVSYDDAAQEAVLQLIRKPPRFDPSRGAAVKTLIYTIVQRAVIKFATREQEKLGRLRPYPGQSDDPAEAPLGPTEGHLGRYQQLTGAGPTKHEPLRAALEDMLRFIDNEESRAMCWMVIQCDGNYSEVARRMKLSEGTVRYRLKMLKPKLRAAGFKPPWEREGT